MPDIQNPFTRKQVSEWQRLREVYAAEADKAFQKVAALDKALEAASAFFGTEGISAPKRPAEADEGKAEATLVDAIDALLMAMPEPLSHKEIRKLLPKYGFSAERLKRSPNYYYTALNRLMAREENPVQKSEKKKFWIKKSETVDDIFA